MAERGNSLVTVSRAIVGALLLGAASAGACRAADADRAAGPPPGGVTGKVIDSQGKPMAGVRVTLGRRQGEARVALTDPEGVFCFCRVDAARDYTLRVEKEGFATIMESDLSVGRRKIAVRNLTLRDEKGFQLRQGS
ncbi:MAG TPA: carboxypeptidase-like regulatory domain-containing protein [Candidatus Polarisedimenticolia bacterium]|jgi:hypothetical protein|nr:carboxypeptidase-like regulatory domain-containing protein [Candidatus Polarisedimenticolia bacterium]